MKYSRVVAFVLSSDRDNKRNSAQHFTDLNRTHFQLPHLLKNCVIEVKVTRGVSYSFRYSVRV